MRSLEYFRQLFFKHTANYRLISHFNRHFVTVLSNYIFFFICHNIFISYQMLRAPRIINSAIVITVLLLRNSGSVERIQDKREKPSRSKTKKEPSKGSFIMAGTTRLELATSCVTGMRSNQTELRSHKFNFHFRFS